MNSLKVFVFVNLFQNSLGFITPEFNATHVQDYLEQINVNCNGTVWSGKLGLQLHQLCETDRYTKCRADAFMSTVCNIWNTNDTKVTIMEDIMEIAANILPYYIQYPNYPITVFDNITVVTMTSILVAILTDYAAPGRDRIFGIRV